MSLYFITSNKSKFGEVKSVLGTIEQLDIDLPEIQDMDARVIIRAKLEEAKKHHDGDFIVEDTSLYLSALNGLPGPLIKWFLKALGNDGLYTLATKFQNTEAEAKTIIGYLREGEVHFFEGVVPGKIVAPRGESGFGWDAIFQPLGKERTFAEMTAEEKNSYSMRRIAAQKLTQFLGN